MIIKDWKQLEVGKFYKLSCGCAGMVKWMSLPKEGRDEYDTGFYMTYSNGLGCGQPIAHSLEKAYREGYGPYSNYFNGFLSDQAMPAEEMQKPEWWDELVTPRLAKRQG